MKGAVSSPNINFYRILSKYDTALKNCRPYIISVVGVITVAPTTHLYVDSRGLVTPCMRDGFDSHS